MSLRSTVLPCAYGFLMSTEHVGMLVILYIHFYAGGSMIETGRDFCSFFLLFFYCSQYLVANILQ